MRINKKRARIEILEDEEDIREGLKALSEEGDTVTWEEYQEQRAKRKSDLESRRTEDTYKSL